MLEKRRHKQDSEYQIAIGRVPAWTEKNQSGREQIIENIVNILMMKRAHRVASSTQQNQGSSIL